MTVSVVGLMLVLPVNIEKAISTLSSVHSIACWHRIPTYHQPMLLLSIYVYSVVASGLRSEPLQLTCVSPALSRSLRSKSADFRESCTSTIDASKPLSFLRCAPCRKRRVGELNHTNLHGSAHVKKKLTFALLHLPCQVHRYDKLTGAHDKFPIPSS